MLRSSFARSVIFLTCLIALVVAPHLSSALTFTRPLAFGSSGTDVSALQQYLKDQGYFHYPTLTGYFGSYTWRALAAFQWDNKLEPVGYVGPKSELALNKILDQSLSSISPSTPAAPAAPTATSTISLVPTPPPAPIYTTPPPTPPAGQPWPAASGGGGGGSPTPAPAPSPTPTPDTTAPVRSAGSPSGTLALNTTSTTLSLTTDEAATCKYSVTSGTTYDSMTVFTTTGGTSHSTSISGLTNGGSYIYYVKCQDTSGNSNSADYTISFTVAADTTSPTVTVTAPSNNSTVTGSSVTILATASDDVSVSGVQFKLDTNTNFGAEDTSSPYSVTWDSTGVSDGAHTIIAVARDGSGNYATSSVVTITVDNTAPAVSLTAPSNGATVSGSSVTVSANASDSIGVVGVQFKANNTDIGSEDTSAPYSITWDTAATSSGSKTLVAVARDAAGNYATSSSIAATVDNTPPSQSSISSGSPTDTTATITWTTDESATSKVVYGLTSSYGSASTSPSFVTSHSLGLTGLTATTTYHYAVVSADGQGNTSTSTDQTFTTAVIVDNTPPVISAIAVATTTTTATVTWTTDENATSTINYGVTSGYGSASSSVSLVTSHSIVLTGLSAGTTYHYQVSSADASNNVATSSDRTFVTAAAPDTTPPTVSMTAPAAGATVSGASVTLSANASDNVAVAGVTFKVNGVVIGSEDTSSPYSVVWDTTATSSGSKTIVAVARDTSGNYATSSVITVTVDNTPPVISAIASSTNSSTATITWTTDESSNSKVVYGTTSAYGTASSSAPLATSHSITVTGLTAATAYHYAVVSADGQGNTATSSDQTFTTVPTWILSGATIDCDFANGLYWNNCGLSTIRATSGHTLDYAPDGNLVYQSFGANVSRITSGGGLTTEESRTNSIRNNSMQNAEVGDGVELLTNTGFATNLSGWTITNAGSSATTWTSAGVVTLHGDGTNATTMDQVFATVAGHSYTVRLNVSSATGALRIDGGSGSTPGSGTIFINGVAVAAGTGGGANDGTTYYFKATTATSWVRIRKSTSGDALLNLASAQLGAMPFVTSGASPWQLSAVDNTMFVDVTGLGTELGMDYIDIRMHGTPVQAHLLVRYESPSGVAAAQGQTWTASAFYKVSGGSTTNVTSLEQGIYETAGSGSLLPETRNAFWVSPAAAPTSFVRGQVSFTLLLNTITNTFSALSSYFTVRAPVDITVRIAWPQEENNNINSSVLSAVKNAVGAGFGNAQTGNITWSGAGCSTNPVLNVTTTAGGAISAVNSVTTAGSCTTFPSSSATTWTASAPLSAGSGASFTLTPTNYGGNVVSATVQNGGGGYTNGTLTVTPIGGTGTAAQINVTVSGGVITGVSGLSTAGSYTTFPSNPVAFVAADNSGNGAGRLNLVTGTNAATATTPIRTTSAAVTRNTDNTQLSSDIFAALQQPSGTIIIQTNAMQASRAAALLGFDSAAVGLQATDGNPLQTSWGGGTLTTANTATWTGRVKVGLRWSPTGRAIVLNGGTIASDATLPTAITAAYLGVLSDGTLAQDGTIEKVSVFSQALPDASFQAMTAP